jgi:hypothetical protein
VAAVTSVEIAGRACTVRDLTPEDRPELLRLHTEVFGEGASEPWYAWKYRAGHGLGSGVWHEGRLIAHCGGVPRALRVEGRPSTGIQIGDVMVSPPWRGVLTRRGPFFHASDTFYAAHVGAGTPHRIAFGFPSERHLRLAVKSGLLRDGGPVHALGWATRAAGTRESTTPSAQAAKTSASALGWTWRWNPLDPASPDFARTIAAAWQRMEQATRDFVVGERDAAYVHWRFFERPGRTSSAFVLRRAWSHQPVGVALLDLSTPNAQWLDWIGAPADMPLACRAVLAQAAMAGAAGVSAWATPAVTQSLAATGCTSSITAWLGIPRRSALDEADVARQRWWLMGGDTDFL